LNFIEAIVLALVQGLTEFLPISSSAHLILMPRLLGWTDQGLAFDVAVHFGTLLAVLGYFRAEVLAILRACSLALLGRAHDGKDARLGWELIVATLPIIVVGFLFEDFIETSLRSPLVIAATTAVFGVLLWVADLQQKEVSDERRVGFRIALLIGLAQVLALIPGTSRSGITITAGLALGLSRSAAARFSFLLAMPAIAGAATLETAELISSPLPVDWAAIFVGLVAAAISAYACIRVFLGVIDRIGMLPFMIYRVLLAGFLVWVFV
jgi:undecaprenyl-diphosphatase